MITGNVLSVGTYTVDCPLAGLIINAQMLQNVSALQGKNYSQLAESIAKKRNLALTASGTKDSSDYTKRVAATQQEITGITGRTFTEIGRRSKDRNGSYRHL